MSLLHYLYSKWGTAAVTNLSTTITIEFIKYYIKQNFYNIGTVNRKKETEEKGKGGRDRYALTS